MRLVAQHPHAVGNRKAFSGNELAERVECVGHKFRIGLVDFVQSGDVAGYLL